MAYREHVEFVAVDKFSYKAFAIAAGRKREVVGEFLDEKTALGYANFDVLCLNSKDKEREEKRRKIEAKNDIQDPVQLPK